MGHERENLLKHVAFTIALPQPAAFRPQTEAHQPWRQPRTVPGQQLVDLQAQPFQIGRPEPLPVKGQHIVEQHVENHPAIAPPRRLQSLKQAKHGRVGVTERIDPAMQRHPRGPILRQVGQRPSALDVIAQKRPETETVFGAGEHDVRKVIHANARTCSCRDE